MTGFYSLPAPRIWRGERLLREAEGRQPDPYASTSPGHRERTRETVTQIGLGLTRVDLGEPIKRLAAEPQPVTVNPVEELAPLPVSTPAAPAVPTAQPREPSGNWRADYGLSKRG